MHLTLRNLALAMALFALGCRTPASEGARPRGAEAPVADAQELVRQALPAVVLLVQERPDGKVAYGSGFLVSGPEGQPRVLTNLHVVGNGPRLKAMLYREGRVSYTPMDGGLSRYLFEYGRELVSAEVERTAPSMDLALVKVDADLSRLPRLQFAREPAQVGERVYALGHPQETVWSFTTGVVSAIHNGAVQHDAVISQGSSGGPLLNASGQVVGINTSRVISEARGMAFARPAELAEGWLSGAAPSGGIRFAVLEDAVTGCWRAEEVGALDLGECFDVEQQWAPMAQALAELQSELHLTPEELAHFSEEALGGDKASYLEASKRGFMAYARGEPGGATCDALGTPAGPAPLAMQPERRRRLEALANKLEALRARRARHLLEQNHLLTPPSDGGAFRATIRMGMRVDEVRRLRPDLAWVRFTGRNTDGSEFTFSEAWAFHDGRWFQHNPPSPEDVSLLPHEFPGPLDDYRWRVDMFRAQVARRLLGLPPDARAPVNAQAG